MPSQEIRQFPGAKHHFFYGYIVVVATFLIHGMLIGAHTTFGIFFKPVLTEFGWTRGMTSGAFSLSMFLSGLLGIVMGRLNDRLGPRVVATLCGFFVGLGYLLMSQVGAMWQLYLFYGVVIGVGMAGVFVPLMSTVVRWFVRGRTTVTGIVAAGAGIGILVAAPVANWLISIYSWRVAYIILGGVLLILVVLVAQLLRRDPAQLGQLPYGSSGGEEQEVRLGTTGLSLKEAVYTKQFWLAFSIFLCFGLSSFSILVHIVLHATELGISTASAANILATLGGLTIVGNVALGRVADRIGNKQVYIISFILISVALFWLVIAREEWMLYLVATILGFASGGCVSSESPLVASLFGLRSHGLILGVAELGFSIGACVGPFVAGHIFDVTGSYQVAFLVFVAIAVVGLVSAALLTPIRGERGKIKTT